MMRLIHFVTHMADSLDYASSGVDIDLEGNAVGALVSALSN